MYRRIKSGRDLSNVRAGTLLIQFPLKGGITDELNLSSPEEFELYEVERVEDNTIRLLYSSDTSSSIPTNPPDASPIFLIKHAEALLQEENWWHEDH
ncbi:MAG: hypothetical protein J7527_02660 [Chitinophagaceae bacterium]|nr:hypothetical protein [Chitinophagaceae bacterium]